MGETTESVWKKWQWRCLLAVALAIASFNVAGSLSHLARASGLLRDWQFESHMTAQPLSKPIGGWAKVTEIRPGGAAERAGLRAGDLVHSEAFGVMPSSVLAPGARLPLLVEREGRKFRADYIFPDQPRAFTSPAFVFASMAIASLVSTLLGALLLLLRGRRNRAAATLGMVLQFLGFTVGGFGYVWAPAPIVFQTAEVLRILAVAGLCYFLPLAGQYVSGGQSGREGRLVRALAAFFAVASASWMLPWLIPGFVPSGAESELYVVPVIFAGLLCFTCIARNYPRNEASARNRIKIVSLALIGYSVSYALFVWFNLEPAVDRVWAMVASVIIGLAAPAFIAYAMLRKRLFDLNFALNRTLVYGAVSFVLLAAFGIAKWVVEHLIPESWHEGSEFYSFGIALLLFLSLHRVHDWVERNVERVFFHRWHQNEAELRRFVAAAAHYDQAPALCRSFAAELSRFAQGAGSAIYLREEGAYRLCAGNPTEAEAGVDSGDHAIALMRAERAPVDLVRARSTLPGVLALPMLDQGRLSGFALLAAKSDGTAYRPDEIDVLGWAAHQVGLDLQAMNAHELETKLAGLSQLVETLTVENGRLTELLSGGKIRSTA